MLSSKNKTKESEVNQSVKWEKKESLKKTSIDGTKSIFSDEGGSPFKSEEKFNLAGALGKTKESMENDFYVFQIKEFMSKIGQAYLPPVPNFNQVENDFIQLERLCAVDVLTTPVVFKEFVRRRPNLFSRVGKTVLIDYPYGESTPKARLTEIKELIKLGVKNVVAMVPCSMENLNVLEGVKSSFKKLSKKVGEHFSIGVLSNNGEEQVKKIMKEFATNKAESFTLFCEGLTGAKLKATVKYAVESKGGKKLFIYTDVKSLSELSEITELGVDKVYTSNTVQIGMELADKFGVTLI